ncbi:MAG: hypothetical protein ACOC31_03625 [Bacteroidota bacterium]
MLSAQNPWAREKGSMYVNDEEYFSWGIKSIYQAWEKIGFIAGFAGSFTGNMDAHSPYIMTGVYWEP